MGLASQTSAGDDPLHPPATDVFVLTQHRPLAARRRLWPLEDNARLLGSREVEGSRRRTQLCP